MLTEREERKTHAIVTSYDDLAKDPMTWGRLDQIRSSAQWNTQEQLCEANSATSQLARADSARESNWSGTPRDRKKQNIVLHNLGMSLICLTFL